MKHRFHYFSQFLFVLLHKVSYSLGFSNKIYINKLAELEPGIAAYVSLLSLKPNKDMAPCLWLYLSFMNHERSEHTLGLFCYPLSKACDPGCLWCVTQTQQKQSPNMLECRKEIVFPFHHPNKNIQFKRNTILFIIMYYVIICSSWWCHQCRS